FLAFHGPRSGAGAGPAAPNHSAGGQAHPEEEEPAAQQAHHEHLHDAPAPMALALIVLAIGSVVAGYAGLGGRFEHFLAPSFEPQRVEAAVESTAGVTLMMVSTIVAIAGIGIATYFFLGNRRAADRVA